VIEYEHKQHIKCADDVIMTLEPLGAEIVIADLVLSIGDLIMIRLIEHERLLAIVLNIVVIVHR
jgi:hypothetical protein